LSLSTSSKRALDDFDVALDDFDVPFQKVTLAVELSVKMKYSDPHISCSKTMLQGFNKIVQLPPV
jgi:hypothetical protein